MTGISIHTAVTTTTTPFRKSFLEFEFFVSISIDFTVSCDPVPDYHHPPVFTDANMQSISLEHIILKAPFYEMPAPRYGMSPYADEIFQVRLRRGRLLRIFTPGMTNGMQDRLTMKELILPNSGTELLKVRPSDIVYVEAEGNYCCMYLTGGFKQQLWFNRQKFIAIINEQMKAERPTFVVVGRSFIINIAYIYLINPVQGDLILFDAANPSRIKLHASQEALNRLKKEIGAMSGVTVQ